VKSVCIWCGSGGVGDDRRAAELTGATAGTFRLSYMVMLFIHSPEQSPWSENGVRLAQKMPVGPCIPVGAQRQKAGVGPTSGPTWRVSHLGQARAAVLLAWGDNSRSARGAVDW
jgi:hypothetical protein